MRLPFDGLSGFPAAVQVPEARSRRDLGVVGLEDGPYAYIVQKI